MPVEQKLEETLISSDIEFKGEIKFDTAMNIHGSIEGSIESKGRVSIMPSANIKADLTVASVFLEGNLQGNINQAKFVHIFATGKLKGDIHSKELQINRRAYINGVVTM